MTLLTLGGRLHGKSVAFAATSLGISLINRVFFFYYVKVYLNRFHVTEPWFEMAHVIFTIWNLVNESLFGCLQDNARFLPAMRSRRHSILYGAPFFVFVFVSAWFPWSNYEATGSDAPEPWVAGLQLTCVLCLYDGFLTFVVLAERALFAELPTDQVDRVRLIRYSHVASLIGSMSVLLCDAASGGLADFDRFRMVCCGLGVAAGACFVYTGLKAHTQFDRHDVTGGNGGGKSPSVVDVDQKPLAGIVSQPVDRDTASVGAVLRQTEQIIAQRSFVSFVLTNVCQIYHTTFLINFAIIIGECLIGDALSSTTKSFLYWSLFLVPQVINKLQT
jgi:Na+/melibiose symporter-like transporter